MDPQAAGRDKADVPHGFQGGPQNRVTSTITQFGTRVGGITNDRSLNLETFQGVEAATLDLYAAVRNAYGQKRAKAVGE